MPANAARSPRPVVATTTAHRAGQPAVKAVPGHGSRTGAHLGRHPLGVPAQRAPYRPAPIKIAAPPGVDAWRNGTVDTERLPARAAVDAICKQVRSGGTAMEAAAAGKVELTTALHTVATIGSRIAQADKSGARVGKVHAARMHPDKTPGSVHEITVPAKGSTQEPKTALLVVAAYGYTGQHDRDIRRAYAAMLTASNEQLQDAVEQCIQRQEQDTDIRYTHLADLYSADLGTLPAMNEFITEPPAISAYLAAWDMLEDALVQACRAADALMATRHPQPRELLAMLRAVFWLMPDLLPLAQAAQASLAAPNDRELSQRVLIGLRRAQATWSHKPAVLRPKRLSDLSRTQFRALTALLGHPVHVPRATEGDSGLEEMFAAARVAAGLS